MADSNLEALADEFQSTFSAIRAEIGKVIVGNQDIIENVLVCFFAGGHVLLEGVPGLGKTMLVKTMADVCDLQFSRIQFTPDLMPADIIGTDVVHEDESGNRTFDFRPGPIHSQLVLADEINRATPKTQSAMLEAMQEGQVTSGRHTYKMRQPFLVLATQNPIEMEGTYPLPEAQLDRFQLKLKVVMASREELKEVISRTTGDQVTEVAKIMDEEKGLRLRNFVKSLIVADNIRDFTVRLILAAHPDNDFAPSSVRKYVRFGSSPRGAQALTKAAKVYAAMDGRLQVGFEDIKRAALPALRHRMILNFEGEAEGVETDSIVNDILTATPDMLP